MVAKTVGRPSCQVGAGFGSLFWMLFLGSRLAGGAYLLRIISCVLLFCMVGLG